MSRPVDVTEGAAALGIADYTASPKAPATPSEIFRTLFVYGPLMADEVLMALLGRVPSQRPATLVGWIRCCKKGAQQIDGVCSTHRGLVAASYPAAVRTDQSNHQIDGILLERLRPQELRCLDHCAHRATAKRRNFLFMRARGSRSHARWFCLARGR